MENKNKNSKDLLVAAAIGGIVGIVGTSIYLSRKGGGDQQPLNSLGRVMVKLGEVLDDPHISDTKVAKTLEKEADRHEATISAVLNLVTLGMQFWEKIKRG
ncbi:MAG: hypothetical protein ACHQT8_04955 [Chlamydiales bacterium]